MDLSPDFLAVRMVLLREWDPFGVGDNPNLADEYDSFIPRILVVMKGGNDLLSIGEELIAIETELEAPVPKEQRARTISALRDIANKFGKTVI